MAEVVMTRHAAPSPEPLVYSVEQAADLFGIGRTFMFRLLATGEIESFKIGKRRKITRDAPDGYLGRLRREQAAAVTAIVHSTSWVRLTRYGDPTSAGAGAWRASAMRLRAQRREVLPNIAASSSDSGRPPLMLFL